VTQPSASPSRFIGQSLSVRYLPWLAIIVGCFSVSSNVPFAFVMLALGAYAIVTVPWLFVIDDSGIVLRFGFGRRRFLGRSDVAVRVNRNGVLAIPSGDRFGYPLTDGFSTRRAVNLRVALEGHGFRILP